VTLKHLSGKKELRVKQRSKLNHHLERARRSKIQRTRREEKKKIHQDDVWRHIENPTLYKK